MGRYEELKAARELLGISEESTIEEIKKAYRSLLKKWHPDKKRKDIDKCNEMVRRIINAYNLLIEYCNNYRISFSKKEVSKYLSDEQWWFERFGEDPIWNKTKKKE